MTQELTRELVNEDVPLEQQMEMVRDSAEIISKENSLLKEANDTLTKEVQKARINTFVCLLAVLVYFFYCPVNFRCASSSFKGIIGKVF